MIIKTAVLAVLLAWTAFAQTALDQKIFDRIGKNARESSKVELDPDTIRMGAGLLGDGKDGDSKKLKDALSGLQGVMIRTFGFEKEGQYDAADLKPIREYLDGLGWSKIVDVKEKKEESAIYIHAGTGKMGGIAIFSAEPKEVTLVLIQGSLSMDKIAALSGKMGIPDMKLSHSAGAKSDKKDEEN